MTNKSLLTIVMIAQLFNLTYAQLDFFKNSLGILNNVKEPLTEEYIDCVSLVKVRWIEQPLNHFDRQDERTWRMRYLQNEEHYKKDGPIFIFVGGETTVNLFPVK